MHYIYCVAACYSLVWYKISKGVFRHNVGKREDGGRRFHLNKTHCCCTKSSTYVWSGHGRAAVFCFVVWSGGPLPQLPGTTQRFFFGKGKQFTFCKLLIITECCLISTGICSFLFLYSLGVGHQTTYFMWEFLRIYRHKNVEGFHLFCNVGDWILFSVFNKN